MKNFFLLFICVVFETILYAQISICSWNIENIGSSKSDSEIDFIANTIKYFDVVAIQEVVAKDPGGAQAIARLSDALNGKGFKWDYRISEPTSGENSYKKERYAFLWKTSKVSMAGKPWLEIKYSNEINREPYFATFKSNGKVFTVVNFHAITKSMQPETEIKYFRFLPLEYPDENLIFCGDFNCPQSHTVFNPLKTMGYKPILVGQKTSLKETCLNNECLSSEYDNMFYNASKVTLIKSGAVLFYESFSTLNEARVISDHIPVYFQFSLN